MAYSVQRSVREYMPTVECYQCSRVFVSMRRLAVHCYYHPGHRVTKGLRRYLPDNIE